MTTIARLPTGMRATLALILREMSTSYGRSPGGWIWAVVQPVGAIAMMSLAFSMAIRTPSLGFSFPLFYASGLLPYMLFNDLSNKLGQALRYSRALMSYPAVTIIDALAARLLFNALIHAVIFLLVISGCLILFDARAAPEPLLIAEAFGLALVLAGRTGEITPDPIWSLSLHSRSWSGVGCGRISTRGWSARSPPTSSRSASSRVSSGWRSSGAMPSGCWSEGPRA